MAARASWAYSLREDSNVRQQYISILLEKLLWMMGEEDIQPFSSLSLSYMGEISPFFGASDELHLGAAECCFRILHTNLFQIKDMTNRFDKLLYDKESHRVPSLRFRSKGAILFGEIH